MQNTPIMVGVIGAGTMGQGIVQLALQAGHPVILIDTSSQQLDDARAALTSLFNKFESKQKISTTDKKNWLAALYTSTDISTDNKLLTDAGLVIEAIVERLEVKQTVFRSIEAVVGRETILATNTSSLSVTEIASGLSHTERFIGLHFFNPPGIMPLVEVIDALQTSEVTTATCLALMQAWGKKPVRCKNTPGFIVNRIARPFYVESFRLLEDNITIPEQLDASIRSAGFKMGPCELTDFIGQDINFAVSCSLFDSLFYPAHLRPSYIQGSLVEAGFYGRKSGRGFYDYSTDKKPPTISTLSASSDHDTISFIAYGEKAWSTLTPDTHSNRQSINEHSSEAAHLLSKAPYPEYLIGILDNEVHLYLTDGNTAAHWEQKLGLAVALADVIHPNSDANTVATVAIAAGSRAQCIMNDTLPEPIGGIHWNWVVDDPGLINLRVISMIINEATICATQGIATPEGIDSALKGGVNYPLGAFEWLETLGIETVINTLSALRQRYGSARYIVPPKLLNMKNERQTEYNDARVNHSIPNEGRRSGGLS